MTKEQLWENSYFYLKITDDGFSNLNINKKLQRVSERDYTIFNYPSHML